VELRNRIQGKRNTKRGQAAEEIAELWLRQHGYACIEKIETPWRIVRRGGKIVLMGHRPYLYPDAHGKRDNAIKDYAEWEITKNRQGAEWNIKMKWWEKYQLFQEIAIEYGG
jgi:hypothetical protein